MFIDKPLKFNLFKNHVFCSSPPPEDVEYIKWLDRVEWKSAHYWKYLRIYDLTQLSRVSLPYNPNMLIASMCIWDTSTNTFHLPCGMITPIFFNIATIVSLRPTGMDFDPAKVTKTDPPFSFSRPAYISFIEDHRRVTHDISMHEHITFLTYWFSRYVLSTRFIQVAKNTRPLQPNSMRV